jgi:hypothetical protein
MQAVGASQPQTGKARPQTLMLISLVMFQLATVHDLLRGCQAPTITDEDMPIRT